MSTLRSSPQAYVCRICGDGASVHDATQQSMSVVLDDVVVVEEVPVPPADSSLGLTKNALARVRQVVDALFSVMQQAMQTGCVPSSGVTAALCLHRRW